MSNESNGAGSTESVQQQLEEISSYLKQVHVAQRKMRKVMTWGGVAIVAVLCGFGYLSYGTLEKNLTTEKLRVAAEPRVKQLAVELEAPMRAAIDDVTPFYMRMGKARLTLMGPKLERTIRSETDSLGQTLEREIDAQLQAMITRIMGEVTLQLKQDFPAISTTEGGERATQRLKEVTQKEVVALTEHGTQLYQTQAGRIRAALEKLPVPDVAHDDLDTLQRRLLHALLMLADHELTSEAMPQQTAAAR